MRAKRTAMWRLKTSQLTMKTMTKWRTNRRQNNRWEFVNWTKNLRAVLKRVQRLKLWYQMDANASISSAVQRRFTRRYVQKFSRLSIDFYVNHAMTAMLEVAIASFANRFTLQIMTMMTRTWNGLDVTIAIAG